MSDQVIQAKYEELAGVAQRLSRSAQSTMQLRNQVTRAAKTLEQGGWQGRGSTAFFAEMNGVVYPGLQRLIGALEEARAVTVQASEIMRRAEDEAARLFQGAAGTTGALGNGAAVGGNGAAAPNAATTPGTAIPTLPTQEIFSHAYYDRLVGMTFQGAGSAQLNQAMETLVGNPSPTARDHALDQIAAARGLPRDVVQAQYERYIDLRNQADATATMKGHPHPDRLDEGRHPEFMGRTAQLRYGKLVGDALGLDPVFGALLNPTGGLVGPGNTALDLGDRAVSYHGAFHDAAGYLYNYHNMGPGYNYLGLENRDTSSPFTGQEAGIRYWNQKLGTNPLEAAVTEEAGARIGQYQDVKEVGQAVERGWNRARDWFSDTFDF